MEELPLQFIQLMKLLGMEEGEDLDSINDWAQANLLRRGERWEKQSDRYEPLRPEILGLLRELGFVDAKYPVFDEYEGAIVHGGQLSTVELRVNFLIRMWKRGVRFSDLYFLTGERHLKEQILGVNTETEMIKRLWEISDVPEKMRNGVQVHYIHAKGKGPEVRPTTDDTVVTWLAEDPTPGRYLAVSNAPYRCRQDLVKRSIAPKEFLFDTVGPEADPEAPIALFLDEVARTIYQMRCL